jgi:hypothetical protein
MITASAKLASTFSSEVDPEAAPRTSRRGLFLFSLATSIVKS